MEDATGSGDSLRDFWTGRVFISDATLVAGRLCIGLSGRELVYRAGSLGTAAKAGDRCAFSVACSGGREREHRSVGRRLDAVVSFLLVRSTGTFRPGPNAAGNTLAFSRSAQVCNGAG